MIRPSWLRVAEQESRSGIREQPGARHHPRILEYHETTTLKATEDEVPWCASFVGWCLRQVAIRHTESAAARSYLRWGRDLGRFWAHGAVAVLSRGPEPQPGPDVIEYPDGGFVPGHVGFLVGEPTPDEVLILGANQEDAVNIRPYPRRRLLSVRWPGREDPHR